MDKIPYKTATPSQKIAFKNDMMKIVFDPRPTKEVAKAQGVGTSHISNVRCAYKDIENYVNGGNDLKSIMDMKYRIVKTMHCTKWHRVACDYFNTTSLDSVFEECDEEIAEEALKREPSNPKDASIETDGKDTQKPTIDPEAIARIMYALGKVDEHLENLDKNCEALAEKMSALESALRNIDEHQKTNAINYLATADDLTNMLKDKLEGITCGIKKIRK